MAIDSRVDDVNSSSDGTAHRIWAIIQPTINEQHNWNGRISRGLHSLASQQNLATKPRNIPIAKKILLTEIEITVNARMQSSLKIFIRSVIISLHIVFSTLLVGKFKLFLWWTFKIRKIVRLLSSTFVICPTYRLISSISWLIETLLSISLSFSGYYPIFLVIFFIISFLSFSAFFRARSYFDFLTLCIGFSFDFL